MSHTRGCSAVLATILSLTACQSLADGAKEAFAKDYSCPADRVESRDRPDLRHSSFDTAPNTLTPKPPPDIAADPARLAMWQQRHQRDPTEFDRTTDVEEVRGCGKQAFYFCHGGQRHSLQAKCAGVATVPSSISHW
jgi:hypothetical protein